MHCLQSAAREAEIAERERKLGALMKEGPARRRAAKVGTECCLAAFSCSAHCCVFRQLVAVRRGEPAGCVGVPVQTVCGNLSPLARMLWL